MRNKDMSLKQKGFTLIELMIVVAIMGVIVAIAVPAFNNNVNTATRQCVRADLLEWRGELERNYGPNGFRYLEANVDPQDYNDCGYTYTTTYFDTAGLSANRTTVTTAFNAQTYIASARPVANGNSVGLGAFTLSSAGILCYNAGSDTPLATTAAHVTSTATAVCPEQL